MRCVKGGDRDSRHGRRRPVAGMSGFREYQPGELSGKIGTLAGTTSSAGAITRVTGRGFAGRPYDAGSGRPREDRISSVMGYIEILLIAGLILINGFFVTAEFALVKVRATQIDQLAEQGNWAAKLTSKALDRLDFYLSASQIGITIASLALGSAMHDWVEPMVRAALAACDIRRRRIVVFGVSIATVPLAALSLVTFLHMALGEQAPKTPGDPRAQGPGAADRAAAGDPVLRLLAGDLAAEQGEQPDALGAGPGPHEHVRAGPLRRRAAADRGRERGRRPPVAQRADDDRERAQPGGEDGASGDGPAAGHRLPEPRAAARGQPADRPPGGPHAVPALRGRPDLGHRHDPRQGHLPHRVAIRTGGSTCGSSRGRSRSCR